MGAVTGVVAEHPGGVAGEVLVSCSAHRGTLAPLIEARRLLLAGQPGVELWDVASRSLRGGLRRQLLGESGDDRIELLVHSLGRAAGQGLVVLDQAELLDDDSVRLLERALRRPGYLPVSVRCVFRRVPSTDLPAGRLARALGLEPPAEAPAAAPLRSLPPLPSSTSARLVLRCAAALGPEFTVDEIAHVLDQDPLRVLEALQAAADAGTPLIDGGDGHLQLPSSVARALERGLLPSLVSAWQVRAAEAHRAPPAAVAPAPAEAPPSPPEPEPSRREETAVPVDPDTRQLLQAFQDALVRGDLARGQVLGLRALQRLEPVTPGDDPHRMLRITLLVELAHLRWRASGEASTLRDAQTLARRAKALLRDGDPADRVADVLATLAAIGHDLGDAASLDESLDALTEAIRSLQESGDAIGAAQLLNDQAAVWIRLGDPVRGAHLLRTSRQIFEDRSQTEPAALRELAETEHLLARLPLHVGARTGAEDQALRAALEHAAHAEEAYRRLQLPLEVGRTLETRGRLLGHTGQAQEALAVLTRAVEVQQQIGDALGLARTTGALSEVLGSAGRASEALALLADSVSLNLATGSPIGLAHNRRALQALAAGADEGELLTAVQQLQDRIEAGEQLVGRAETRSVPAGDEAL